MKIKRIVVGPVQTNCYIIESEGEIGIIDPGGDTRLILEEIKKLKAKIKYIINTHYHFDHTLANEELKRETKAKIIIHKDEEKYIEFKVDRFVVNDDIIKIGKIVLKVIHTPGHTEGGICLLGEKIIFTGDTLFKEGTGRTDLSGGSEEKIINSLQKIFKIIKPGYMVYPGHGEYYEKTL